LKATVILSGKKMFFVVKSSLFWGFSSNLHFLIWRKNIGLPNDNTRKDNSVGYTFFNLDYIFPNQNSDDFTQWASPQTWIDSYYIIIAAIRKPSQVIFYQIIFFTSFFFAQIFTKNILEWIYGRNH